MSNTTVSHLVWRCLLCSWCAPDVDHIETRVNARSSRTLTEENWHAFKAMAALFFSRSRSFFVNYCVVDKVIIFYSPLNFIIINSTVAGYNKQTTQQKCEDSLCGTSLCGTRECVQIHNAQWVHHFMFVSNLAIKCATCFALTAHFAHYEMSFEF